MEKINNLKDMMLQQIRSLYDADQLLYHSLSQLREQASTEDLRNFIEQEDMEKQRQQHRMEMIFTILKENPEGENDEIIRCMNESQRKLAQRCIKRELSDTMIIIIKRAMTMHQINGYQTAISCAVAVEHHDIARLLRRALREEKAMEKRLGLLEEVHLGRSAHVWQHRNQII